MSEPQNFPGPDTHPHLWRTCAYCWEEFRRFAQDAVTWSTGETFCSRDCSIAENNLRVDLDEERARAEYAREFRDESAGWVS